jgi:hypothetical protein
MLSQFIQLILEIRAWQIIAHYLRDPTSFRACFQTLALMIMARHYEASRLMG